MIPTIAEVVRLKSCGVTWPISIQYGSCISFGCGINIIESDSVCTRLLEDREISLPYLSKPRSRARGNTSRISIRMIIVAVITSRLRFSKWSSYAATQSTASQASLSESNEFKVVLFHLSIDLIPIGTGS